MPVTVTLRHGDTPGVTVTKTCLKCKKARISWRAGLGSECALTGLLPVRGQCRARGRAAGGTGPGPGPGGFTGILQGENLNLSGTMCL